MSDDNMTLGEMLQELVELWPDVILGHNVMGWTLELKRAGGRFWQHSSLIVILADAIVWAQEVTHG